jgi:hypothetical protein
MISGQDSQVKSIHSNDIREAVYMVHTSSDHEQNYGVRRQ